jgi:hypothetical protein
MWRGADCVGTFQLAQRDLPALLSSFVEQLTGADVAVADFG